MSIADVSVVSLRDDLLEHVEVLRAVCRRAPHIESIEDGVVETLDWAMRAVGTEEAGARVALVDTAGEPTERGSRGELAVLGPPSTVRRTSMERGVPERVALRLRHLDLLILPLVHRGRTLGTLEVVARGAVLLERADLLEAISEQAAMVFGTVEPGARSLPPSTPNSGSRAPLPGEGNGEQLAWAAHEMRSPILAARAAIQEVIEARTGSAPDRDLLVLAEQELGELAERIDSLLQPRDALRGSSEIVELAGLIEEAASACERRGEAGRISVAAEPPILVRADRAMLNMAVGNLVRNALLYSEGGVRVEASILGEDATVRVMDRGRGIPLADREVIFEPFARGRNALALASGTGLGLHVARRVIEAHGGAIWFETGGDGTTFHVALPLEARH